MNSKNLHKHAVPIVMIAVVALVVSIGATSWLRTSQGASSATLRAGLTTSLVSVHRTRNGLADIQVRPSGQSVVSAAQSLGVESNLDSTTIRDMAFQSPELNR